MEKPSLLTRDESSAIKGLLMLLIVFGHSLHFTQESVGLGIVIYMLTLAISIGLALVMVKASVLNKVLFPNGN